MAELLAACVRSRLVSAVCLVGLLAAMRLPEGGPRLPVCQFRVWTGLPCFGCGLTRSVVALAHWDVGAACFYHPAGFAVFPAALAFALLLPARRATRERLAWRLERSRRAVDAVGVVLLAGFVLYGFGRIVWVALSGRPSPW